MYVAGIDPVCEKKEMQVRKCKMSSEMKSFSWSEHFYPSNTHAEFSENEKIR